MTTSERTPAFREDLCNLCGKCLHLCPVLHLPLEVAKIEVKRLIKGEESKYVLNKCNTCLSCNLYCPQEVNPYQLILERWNDRYKKRGAPPLYRFICPTEDPNIWQLLNHFLSNRERRWIYKWMNSTPKSEDTILLLGNYTHLFPFIIGGSKLLENLKPIDKIDQWEGGAYLYQVGYLDIVQNIAERCKRDFDKWGAKNIIHLLDAVQYIFSEVHPKEMGVHYEKNFINFNEWMLEKLNSREIKIENDLNLDVTIHDNCFSKSLGGKYWDPPRKILAKCGCNIIEMKHIKDNSLCCGFGAGASWVKNIAIPFDIISEGTKKFKEAEKTGASALISYCTGCLYLLWATKELLGSKIDIFHIVEVVRMAMGEKLDYPKAHIKRAWDIIAIITYQLFVSIFQKNFYISRITYNKDKSTYQPKKNSLLRIIRFLFNIGIVRKVYAKFFRFLMPLFNTR
ncbi:MAG: (Fe-S)-binding protein [Candidatus Lokiarchaeota archaeon]|nr:(Fe-S)-binding protein [Candidatus Lokiarchaeota archaeon]